MKFILLFIIIVCISVLPFVIFGNFNLSDSVIKMDKEIRKLEHQLPKRDPGTLTVLLVDGKKETFRVPDDIQSSDRNDGVLILYMDKWGRKALRSYNSHVWESTTWEAD